MHTEVKSQIEILRTTISAMDAKALRSILQVGNHIRLSDGYTFWDTCATGGNSKYAVSSSATAGSHGSAIFDCRVETIR